MKIQTQIFSSWLKGHGNCQSYWIEFSTKAERDFEATQYPEAYKITKGNWKRGEKGNKKEIFWLSIYLPKEQLKN